MDWSGVDEFSSLALAYVNKRIEELEPLLVRSRAALEGLDGDPCETDWRAFRPLSEAREEDWSDWLHHFISTSTTGVFASELFRGTKLRPDDCQSPTVHREYKVMSDGSSRRADLVLIWNGDHASSLEVKVGDQGFSKTRQTAAGVAKRHGESLRAWTHYILLPLEDASTWHDEYAVGEPRIEVLTWEDVAVALRIALRSSGERTTWRVWAHGFCGLIEQQLLGIPPRTSTTTNLSVLAAQVSLISLVKRGLGELL